MTVKQVQAAVVRACLLLHFVMVVWRVTVSWTEQYWLLLLAIIPFLLEGIFTVVRRDGVEWKLFSVCFFFYLSATLPGIWLLEIKKTDIYQSGNFSQINDIVINGVEIPIRLSPDTWVLVVEEMMLYLMILSRWMLPRGEVGREQLTQLLFGFIGIASDIMELFSLFDEDEAIRHNTVLIYVILGVWTLSVMQFTLTFATAHRPRRARGLRMTPSARSTGSDIDLVGTSDLDENRRRQHRKSVLRVELLATVLSMFMQDGPFLGVRLYAMIRYNIITYDLIFFTAKNVLVILLLVYKVFLLLCKICCPSRRHHQDGDDKEDLTHVHPNLDREIVVPNPDFGSLDKGDRRESAELRKRRGGEKGYPEDRDLGVGDLHSAIEGTATPAKPMAKTKKYDSQFSQDNSGTLETALTKDASEDTKKTRGIDNPALDPSPGTDGEEEGPEEAGPEEAGPEEPGPEEAGPGRNRKQSSGWGDDPRRNKPQDLNGGPGTNESLGKNEDPDKNGLERNPSTGQKEDSDLAESHGQEKKPVRARLSGWDKAKKHVSIIKIKL